MDLQGNEWACTLEAEFVDMNNMTFEQKLKSRADGIAAWLRENHPEIKREQAHLDEGTPERAYWHSGYCVALRDVLRLMEQELHRPINKDR